MYLKSLVFLLCATLSYSKKSFTIVIDTSFSMKEEIDVLKSNVDSVFESVDLSKVENYMLVPFKDPDVGPIQNATSSSELLSHINNLSVSGGEECPENALSAIQKALQESKPGSQIFIFTDAYAKDNSKLTEVQNLCQNTNSQVIIILSGSCASSSRSEDGSIDVYFDVARSCKGGILQFDFSYLRKAFDVMKEIIKTEWTEIKTQDVTPYGDITFSVDYSTTDLMIIVHGSCRSIHILDKGENTVNLYTVLHTANILIVRFSELTPGSYKIKLNRLGRTSTTLYKRNDLRVQIGFSTKRTNLMKLTSSSPMPGWMNHILIVLPPESAIRLKSFKLNNLKTHQTSQYSLTEESDYKGQYIISTYFDHDTLFRITFSGHDTSTYVDVTKTTDIMETQKTLWGAGERIVSETIPEVEMIQPKTTLVDYGSNLTIICKVTGYPEPQITWRNENYEELSSENITIEVPNIHASYATINNLKKNVTVYCNARNSIGENSESLDLFVNSTFSFKVIHAPQDQTIEYSTEGRLNCQVESYPQATTSWYHNNTMLSDYYGENIEIESQNSILIIKNMTIDDTGEYKCEVKNDFDTKYYSANIDISGLEAPQVELEKIKIVLKTGDWTQIACVAKGIPTPEITWLYRRDDSVDFGAVPDGVNLKDGNIQIKSAKRLHTGTYRCEANNVLGQDSQDLTVEMQYAPEIKNTMPETLAANEGELVQLECEVEASPAANIRWEISKGDIVKEFDKRHTIDDHHTLSFHASFNDTGNYRCVAENDIGREEKTVQVNVNVEVYIKAPLHKTIRKRVGTSLTLPCEILFGYPVPTTRWEFITTSSIRTVLYRGNSDTNDLHLRNISKDNEGSYICIADNGVTSDSIKISLEVYKNL